MNESLMVRALAQHDQPTDAANAAVKQSFDFITVTPLDETAAALSPVERRDVTASASGTSR
jgi:hypothetical protein